MLIAAILVIAVISTITDRNVIVRWGSQTILDIPGDGHTHISEGHGDRRMRLMNGDREPPNPLKFEKRVGDKLGEPLDQIDMLPLIIRRSPSPPGIHRVIEASDRPAARNQARLPHRR